MASARHDRRGGFMRLFVSALVLLLALTSARAENVDVALALVTDVSRSIDDSEFDLEKNGYRAAFTDPKVLQAIKAGPNGAIAVTYIEFASNYEVRAVVDWMVIRDEASAEAFLGRMLEAPRSYYGRTAIGSGIDFGAQAITSSGFEAARKVIDVCGDGTSNAGREVTEARDDALAKGMIINGLAIINDHPASWTYAHVQPPGGLDRYYHENVTGGPGSFVLAIHDFHEFEGAIIRKLVSEISGLPPDSRFAQLRLP
jgi:Protein of unknown function (DUF1194)